MRSEKKYIAFGAFLTVFSLCLWSVTLSQYTQLCAIEDANKSSIQSIDEDFNSMSLSLVCNFVTNYKLYQPRIRPASKCDNYSYDAILVSHGGVGSSSLFHNLINDVGMKSINDANDMDGIKHAIFPIEMQKINRLMQKQKTKTCATKMIIYTYNEAASAVFSLYRRKYHLHHNMKLHVNPFPRKCFPNNITEYVRAGIDFLGLEDHLNSYLMGGLCWSDVPLILLRSNYRNNLEASKAVARILKTMNECQGEIDIGSLKPDIKELQIMESHYANEEQTREDFKTLKKFYAEFQEKVDNLGYMSIFFRRKHLRLV